MRGITSVAKVVSDALARGEPLLLALAPPPEPNARAVLDALPRALRDVEVASGRAADYDALLVGGRS